MVLADSLHYGERRMIGEARLAIDRSRIRSLENSWIGFRISGAAHPITLQRLNAPNAATPPQDGSVRVFACSARSAFGAELAGRAELLRHAFEAHC